MHDKTILTTVIAAFLGHTLMAAESMKNVADFQKKAREFKSVLTLPEWETTPVQVTAVVDGAIASANKKLDQIGAVKPADLTFANTFLALDDLGYAVSLVANRVGWIKETAPDAAMRLAATDAIKKLEDWSVGVDYREDVYKNLKAFADTKPKLEGEDAKFLTETLRDYTRAGLGLPPDERKKVEELRKELASVGTDFDTNIRSAKSPVKFTKAELEGVPDMILETKGVKTGDDEYTIDANITFQALGVLENAVSEESRKKVVVARESTAKEKNTPVLTRMIELRSEIAHRLGYKSWNDYQIEPRMAKNGATAIKFLEDMKVGLQPKFDQEKAEFAKIKASSKGSVTKEVNLWDWRYCSEQLKKQQYQVDTEELRNFFPFQKTLEGMFHVYERIFGLSIEQLEVPYKWVDDLQLHVVSDASTGEPLGLFYLDMFPRDGKFNHFAQFGMVDGRLLADGAYQRPTAALCCNFPPPGKDTPSLLSHDEVETLFHEFGHAMHTILTRSKYSRFSGTSVPQDFVEAPSQMLERWVLDKGVLDTFAADYRDASKKLPADILEKMRAAKLATIGTHYRRQLSFGLTDLTLHGPQEKGAALDVVGIANRIQSDVFYPIIPGTSMVTSFGHLNGYDGGYYGYAWADAIAADMATVFEQSPEKFLDEKAGMRLRNEIYAQGNSRDVTESIEKFLGRPQSIEPFLKFIGIDTATTKKN